MRLTYARRSGAGEYADARFESARASFRRQTLPALLIIAVPLLVAGAWLYVADAGHRWSWFGGAVFGIGMSFAAYARDTVPAYIENWRTGAEAERRTAARLGRLRRRHWSAVHDVQTGKSNIDHVLVGAAGVFAVETKDLGGSVQVLGDRVLVTQRHDKDAGYKLDDVGASARGTAFWLKTRLQESCGERLWVQALVVFWCDFPQGIVEHDRVVWLHGDRLIDWLAAREQRLSSERVMRVGVAVENLKRDALGETANAGYHQALDSATP